MLALEPIDHVRSTRRDLLDDDWDAVAAAMELTTAFAPEAPDALEDFSHAEVIFPFDRVAETCVERGAPVLVEFLPARRCGGRRGCTS